MKIIVIALILVLSGPIILYAGNDVTLDVSIDIMPLVFFSSLDVSLEMYFSPKVSLNNIV